MRPALWILSKGGVGILGPVILVNFCRLGADETQGVQDIGRTDAGVVAAALSLE